MLWEESIKTKNSDEIVLNTDRYLKKICLVSWKRKHCFLGQAGESGIVFGIMIVYILCAWGQGRTGHIHTLYKAWVYSKMWAELQISYCFKWVIPSYSITLTSGHAVSVLVGVAQLKRHVIIGILPIFCKL